MSVSVPKLNLSLSSTNGASQRSQSRRRINPAQYSKRSTIQSNRTNKSTMSNARRERLLNLQKREKLKALLVKKFRMQYGTSRQMTQVITKAIEQFVTRKKVTEKDLDVLGKQLDAAAKQLGIAANKSIARSSRRSSRREPQQPEIKAISQPISTPGNSALLSTNNGPQFSTLSQSASAPALRSSRKKTGKLEPLKNAPRTPLKQGGEEEEEVEEDWSLIFRYQQKKAGDDTLKERLKFKKVREDTLKSLRQMTEEKQKLHAKAKKYDDDYAASIQQNMKKWKREEDEKIARRKAAIKKQSEIRRRQMEERKARADKEKADQLKWETNLMRRLNRESQMQQERERRKIIEDKKRLINFLAGNAEVRKRKEAIRAREREEDVKRMKEYARILEKQENARKEYFAKRGEKQAKFMQANVEARKDEFESIRAIELRDLRYQKEKEDADLAKEREAKLRRKKNQDNINKWLNDTIQLKAEKKKKEKESYIEINNYAKKKAAEARALEEEEKRKRRQFQRQYQKELAEQVAGREHLYHYVGRVRKRKYASMSDREKALNKSLIKEIRQNAPELLSPAKSPPKASEEEEYSSGIY